MGQVGERRTVFVVTFAFTFYNRFRFRTRLVSSRVVAGLSIRGYVLPVRGLLLPGLRWGVTPPGGDPQQRDH